MARKQNIDLTDQQLEIQGITKEGWGKTQVTTSSQVTREIHIPFSAPQDIVHLKPAFKKKRTWFTYIDAIVSPSPLRVQPTCNHFGHCGGCRWQHIDYSEQVEVKQRQINELFSDYILPHTQVHSIIACQNPFYYRNKMEFSFSSNQKGDKFLGLFEQAKANRVFNLYECHLVDSWFSSALKQVRNWWELSPIEAYKPLKDTGSLRNLTLRRSQASGDRMAILTVSGNPEFALTRKDLDGFCQCLMNVEHQETNGHLSIVLRIQQIAKGKPTQFYEMMLHGPDYLREELEVTFPHNISRSVNFHISPAAFFQPNTVQAGKLYSRALELAGIEPTMTVYDLYCGTGTLGLVAAAGAERVIGIELSKDSSYDAKTNATRLGLSNYTIHQGDVATVLSHLKDKGELVPADVVIVDPPRCGLDAKAIQHILHLKPPIILYISCNPTSQAANVKLLVQEGYQVKHIQPIDQFPHTYHVENIVVLSL